MLKVLKYYIKGTLTQIKYSENFAFLILIVFELFTREVTETFVYNHTETIGYVKK